MSALDGWPAVEPWLCRRSRELVITRTWCTVTAHKTTTAITTSWPLNTRSAARAIRIPEPNCSSLTLSAPESAESDATAGSTVSLSIPPSRRRRHPPPAETSLRRSRSRPQTWEIRQELPNSFRIRLRRPPEVYRKFPVHVSLHFTSAAFLTARFRGSFFSPPLRRHSFRRLDTTLCTRRRRGAREAGAWQRWPD